MCWNTDWIPQKQPPAKTAVSVVAADGMSIAGEGSVVTRAAPDIRCTASRPRAATTIAKTRLPAFIFRELICSSSTIRCLPVLGARDLRDGPRVARREHFHHFVFHVLFAHHPEGDFQSNDDRRDQDILVPAHMAENEKRRSPEPPAEQREDI